MQLGKITQRHPWKIWNSPGSPFRRSCLPAFSCRDAVCNFKGKKRWSKKEGEVVTVQREGRKWKYDETCDSPNLGHVHTGENLDSCPEMVHDKEHILKILRLKWTKTTWWNGFLEIFKIIITDEIFFQLKCSFFFFEKQHLDGQNK